MSEIIRVEHLKYVYNPGMPDETTALDDVSFSVGEGDFVGIIGSTGSGKSTLINLIPRFYDVSAGSVTVDGVDVRDIPQHELRDAIGYVPQKGVLFSGDISSNLRYGGEEYLLREGDFIHFDCTQPHTYCNRGESMTEFTNIVYYIG